ncbi:MAG: adenosylcobinamide-phosphate synthase CbiB [Prevotellaceae bacterium]|nr:adenosylcobinamide-phosphate synthase CbiB [Prevotellaceae bacterium]
MVGGIVLLIAWGLDCLLGDPIWLPHPVVYFGKAIAFGEHHLNKGKNRLWKGAILSTLLIVLTFCLTWAFLQCLNGFSSWLRWGWEIILVFYCLAGTTLIHEVREVFRAVDKSLAEGRKQVARIVGRDTSALSAQEVRTAALETLAENLSDGVVAPLFWYLLLGVPGMMAYKMVNTLDSMIGYKNRRYALFGRWAARIDDAANYIPARLTALLMLLLTGKLRSLAFVWKQGRNHLSPNSGYPEAALAAILNCRFGGPHDYFGEPVWKPYIGSNERELTTSDMIRSVGINRRVEIAMVSLCFILLCL